MRAIYGGNALNCRRGVERGQGKKSALTEIREKFGFKTCAIVTMTEVIEYLYNREINGDIIITDEIKGRIDDYYKQYGAKYN